LINHEAVTSIILHKYSTHFSANHALIAEGLIEGLHGHNYYVEIEFFGKVNSNGIVFDFLSLDKTVKSFVLEWDHYTLLPRRNKHSKYNKNGDNTEIKYGDRFYSIPTNEIKFLECGNITTETLARLFAEKIRVFLEQDGKTGDIQIIKIVIWETPTYSASHTICL
jgi:6-pyruvoyltetrahydropterin/6-carboxytetrahydropterin synthase